MNARPYDNLPDGSRLHHLSFPAQPGIVTLDRLSDADRHYLKEIAKGRHHIIDVGTFLGGSAEAFLSGMPEDGYLITIDTFCGTAATEIVNVTRDLMIRYATERLEPYMDRLTMMVGTSVSSLNVIGDQWADLVFIDAAHDYLNVKGDIDACLRVIKPDGLICGHDFASVVPGDISEEEMYTASLKERDDRWAVHWGVIRAVSETFSKVMLVPDVDSTIWAAKPEWVKNVN